MAKTMGKIALKGLVSLVTGSASGLGSQVRQRLAMKGSKVLAVDINHKTIIEEDVELKSRVSFITGDVSDERFLNDLFTKYPKCDAVVNCAAAYRSYNYLTSYLVSKQAVDVLKNNPINAFGVRGCVINIIGLQEKYDQKYFDEQDVFAQKTGHSFDSLDDKVLALAEDMIANRIRSNSVIVPPNSDLKLFAQLVENIIEDQYIAGQIINMEDESRPYLGTVNDVLAEYHVPPEPKELPLIQEPVTQITQQLPEHKASTGSVGSTRTPLLRIDNKKQ
ncbi:unnamed protein product [Oppiella nova]|uniref:Dehydrogenase/reductase SDR family member 6 n=1 Tax=Oppiella nova TaxID=334625 RepID=A0A7R9LRS5_9ACAR|nr:unnamed protein product [Oppiella nova]CAG2166341.1 unnamed protein product [Oppiella nova]